MPAGVVSIQGRREGVYVLLEAALPGRTAANIGVLLVDPETDRGWLRMRRDFESLAGPDDAEVLDAVEEHIRQCIAENGAQAYLTSLEDSVSNAIRVGERQAVPVDAFSRVVERLYAEHVAPIAVQKFRTHLPLYSLRAAAGRLGEEMASTEEDWVPAPEGMRLSEDLFVAHVVGRSMEPRIPDGSLNLFRLNPAGSRQGRILLIERFGVLEETARYTVKRYTSRKVQAGEDEWRHEQIRLEPLNPEFEPWDVEPDGFAVVAEWLRVIE
ncbi:MAG TPA: S24 family peptidase [Candidatus Acidoferrales bacterium]|nr:S24 family peptidase [Candidatus Acidoferrales bacterium]